MKRIYCVIFVLNIIVGMMLYTAISFASKKIEAPEITEVTELQQELQVLQQEIESLLSVRNSYLQRVKNVELDLIRKQAVIDYVKKQLQAVQKIIEDERSKKANNKNKKE